MTESDGLLFSSEPKSFKMDRRSRAACRLKAAVLHKLVEFLDNYTDDDLAEYIVVLVCNGKHQNQARDDLEAFLGNSSGKFVSWLWNHLSKEIGVLESLALAPPNKDDSTYCHTSNVVGETKGARETEFGTHRLLSNGDPRVPITNSNPKPTAVATVLETSQSPDSGNIRKAPKIHHSSDKSFSEISCDGDKAGLNFQDRYRKMAVCKTSALMKDFYAMNERSINRERPRGPSSAVNVGRLSTPAMDPQNGRRRVSVWDRLGKPCSVDYDANDAKIQNFVTAATGRKRVRHADNWSDPKIEEVDIKEMTGVSGHPAKITLLNLTYEHENPVQAADGINKIQQFKVKDDVDSVYLSSGKANASRIQETCKKIQQSVPINSDTSPGSMELLPISSNASSSRKSIKPLSTPSGNSEASIATPNTQLSQNNLLIDNLDISDFDSQLHKVKRTMLELQTKQVEISKDAKVSLGSSSQLHGVQNQYAEDAEGRTLFVANVHFAAPKKALLLHFSKFGPVVQVILLMDSRTGMPKGCAYIVFRYKDSAEKALALNGTSFFSRILKVMWKADMPEDNLGPRQCGATPLKHSWLQGIGSFHFHKQHYAPHLTWKREHQENGEISGLSEASSKQG